MQAIVLAAGKGTRMRSDSPKVLHDILGEPMLGYVLGTLSELGVRRPVVVVGSGAKAVCSFIDGKKRTGFSPVTVLQKVQKGTGHAVMMAESRLAKRKNEDILVWPGDMPLLKRSTIETFIRN